VVLHTAATTHDNAQGVVLLATNLDITGLVVETDGGARLTTWHSPARSPQVGREFD
jgi:hypothetical protein